MSSFIKKIRGEKTIDNSESSCIMKLSNNLVEIYTSAWRLFEGILPNFHNILKQIFGRIRLLRRGRTIMNFY